MDLPLPTGRSREDIEAEARSLAKELDFLPSDSIGPLVGRIGGTLVYFGVDREVDYTLLVFSSKDFIIRVPNCLDARLSALTIAHELGHYVLHSGRGKTPIIAARYGKSQAEVEANWFAHTFVKGAVV